MNALELQQNFTDARAIRVAIVPVGDISEEKFKEYSDLIKSFGVVDLANITRPRTETSRSPFENLKWQESHLLLNFIDRKATRSDWEDFQVYRKLLGVVGIIHCQSSPDLSAAYSRFEAQLQQFPTVAVSVCFAFDPMMDQPDLVRGNLVMIPNGDRNHLLFYLSTLIIDFSHTLMKHLEKMMTDQDQSAYLSTPLDPCKSWDEISRLKRRKGPRMNKCKGDVCLLAGSPLDSIQYYNQSIEQLKSNSDWEWVAGCMEGFCASLVAIKQMNLSINLETLVSTDQNPAKTADQEIIDKCTEAIGHYNRRKAVNLELELTLKLARFYASLDRKQEACDILMTAYEIGADFSTQEKIILTCSIALMCKTMGFRRKFAFFLREAASLYHKIYNLTTAHYMLNLAAKYYQLEDLDPDLVDLVEEELQRPSQGRVVTTRTRTVSRVIARNTNNNSNNNNSNNNNNNVVPHQRRTGGRREGWNYLQRVILSHLESVAKMINDPLSTCKYVIHLLRTQYPHLQAFKQQELVQDLINFSKQLHTTLNTNANMNVLGFPFILKVTPLSLPSHLVPVAKPAAAGESTGPKGPFIYTPFQKSGKAKTGTMWVQNEMAEVTVVLSNPFSFEIPIQSISLRCTGVASESFPLSLRIPPQTSFFSLSLSVVPLEAGELKVSAVAVKAFHVYSEHPVNSIGIAVPLIEKKKEKEKEIQKNSRNTQTIEPEKQITHITVTPPLPLLSVRYAFHGSALSLFVGERHTTVMEISNIGTQKIEYIVIQLNEFQQDKRPAYMRDEETEDDRPVFRWDANYLASRLPLRPGHSLNLPVHVYAKPGNTGATFVLHYGTHSSSRSRQASLPFALNIQQGPLIANLEIRLASSRALGAMRPFLIHPSPLDPLPSSHSRSLSSSVPLSSSPSISFTPQLVTPRTPSSPSIQKRNVSSSSASSRNPPALVVPGSPVASSSPSPSSISPSLSSSSSSSSSTLAPAPSQNFLTTPSSLAPIPPDLFATSPRSPQNPDLQFTPPAPAESTNAENGISSDETTTEAEPKKEPESVPLLNGNDDSETPEIEVTTPDETTVVLPYLSLSGSVPPPQEDSTSLSSSSSLSSSVSSPALSKPLLGPGKLLAHTYDSNVLSPVPTQHTHNILLSFDASDAPPLSPRPSATPLSPSSPPLSPHSSPPLSPSLSQSSYSVPPVPAIPVPEVPNSPHLVRSTSRVTPVSPTIVLDREKEIRGEDKPGFLSPSSSFNNSGVDSDIALLIFDIENPSSQLFVISCEIDDTDAASVMGHQLVSAPSSTQRAILPIKRVWWSDEAIPPLQISTKQFIRPKKQMTPEEEKNLRLLQTYKRFLTQRVHITWSSIDHTHGRIDLQGLALNAEHLNRLKRDPITVSFSPLNGCSTTVGSFEEIVIVVANQTGNELKDVTLNIQLLNESKPSQKTDVSGLLAWVGPLEVSIPELSPGGVFVHTLVVCAFAIGSYSVVATGILPKKERSKKEIEQEEREKDKERLRGEDNEEQAKQKALKVPENFIFPAPHSFRISVVEI